MFIFFNALLGSVHEISCGSACENEALFQSPRARCCIRGRQARHVKLEANRNFRGINITQAAKLSDRKSATAELGGDDASLPLVSCIAVQDWPPFGKLVLPFKLAKQNRSTFVPRELEVLYLILRSGTTSRSPPP